jgi:hypothetical protein
MTKYTTATVDSNWASTIGILPGSVQDKMKPLSVQRPGISGYAGTITSSAVTSGTNYGNITIVDDVNIAQSKAMLVDIPLVVQGRDVMKELDELRDSVLLLKRHVDMEAKYPKLKQLKDEYERALEKYKTFDTLKESK